MNNYLKVVSLYLPVDLNKADIEKKLSLNLKKGIETAYYFEDVTSFIVLTQFNVLTIIDSSRENIVATLKKLNISDAEHFEETLIFQDYSIEIEAELMSPVQISNEKILIKERNPLYLNIIALAISQSVGMEKYEVEIEKYFVDSKQIIESFNTYSIFSRGKLVDFVKRLTLMRHNMVSGLLLLDKPNIVWDNEDAENIYNKLALILEIKERFEVLEFKLSQLKDEVTMVMDLITHKQNEFLEWVIIVLIAIEIAMGLIEWYGPAWLH